MITFSFTVGNPDDARTAAEVCDFLAERMAPGAAPSTRTRRPSKVADLPKDNLSVPSESAVSDPAALYAALSGAPVAESSPAQVDPPAVTEPEASPRDDRIAKTRGLVKERGGKWFGDYMKSAKIDKKLSDYTDQELTALHDAAVSGNLPVAA